MIEEMTDDTLFEGRLTCRQNKKGYRFSVDAVLVAHFIPPSRNEKILDLGTGCGVIGLIMMYRWRQMIAELSALEVQPSLKRLAEHNFSENGFAVNCVLGDVTTVLDHLKPEYFSYVICNPPYYRIQSGRQSKDGEAKIARHQSGVRIDDFTRAAAAVVKNRGTVVFVYPAERFAELAASLAASRLSLKTLQFVYSYPGSGDARLVLVHCVKNGGEGVKVTPPFYIYSRKNGPYSEEMLKLYEPNSSITL